MHEKNPTMVRSIFKLAVILVIGLVAYNYFYGTPQERARSQQIINKAKDLGQDARNLLREEREKMRAGKYDNVLERLETVYHDLRQVAGTGADPAFLERLSDLTERREDLESQMEAHGELSAAEREELDELTEDTEALMNEMETKGRPGAPY